METLLNERYRIIQTLGSGGFGETFLAEDTQMPSHRRCVIKQLRPIQNNPAIYQLVKDRFQREAAILENLGDSTDQIPTLYAYFQSAGLFYLVQELIEGETLTAIVRRQGLFSESAVRDILIKLLPVLDYVHSRRIIHRDIKPDNIIIRQRDGKPVLIDFGAVRESMATVVNSQGDPTSSIVIGTPGYMPSEQAAGRPIYSSDIYSLGMTAIYLLTGKQPQELETDFQTGEIVWRKHALSVSPTLAGIIDKAIAYHPRERFTTVKEILEALQNTIVSSPVTTPSSKTPSNTVAVSPKPDPQSVPQPIHQSSGQRGILLGSLITGGLIGASILIGFALNKPNSTTLQSEISPTPQTTPTSESSIISQKHNTIKSSEDVSQNNQPPLVSSPATEIARTSPTQAVQNYYDTINQGQYQTAWNLLAPSYQNNKRLHPNGYLSYIDWWGGQVDSINVESLNLINANSTTATVDAQLAYLMKNGKRSPNSVRFFLLWDIENSRWIVSDVR